MAVICMFIFGLSSLVILGNIVLEYHRIDMSIYADKIIFENENGTFYFPMNQTEVHNATYVTLPNASEFPAGVFM